MSFKFKRLEPPKEWLKRLSDPIRKNYAQDIELSPCGRKFNEKHVYVDEINIVEEIRKVCPASIEEQLAYTDFATQLYYGDVTGVEDIPKDENSMYDLKRDIKKYRSRVKEWYAQQALAEQEARNEDRDNRDNNNRITVQEPAVSSVDPQTIKENK